MRAPHPRPRVVGVTGGLGSGKSTVARMFGELGAVVVDADQVAHELMEPGGPSWRAILELFGEGVLTGHGGPVDRKRLGELVFADPGARRRLERATHPLILAEVRRRVEQALSAGAPLVVVEIPLLFEAGEQARSLVDAVVVVDAPGPVQILRAVARGGMSEERVRAVMAAQMPLAEKRRLADYVIDNGSSPEQTRRQVEQLWGEWTGGADRVDRP